MNGYTGSSSPSQQSQPCYGCGGGTGIPYPSGGSYNPASTSTGGTGTGTGTSGLPTGIPSGPVYGPGPTTPGMSQQSGGQTMQSSGGQMMMPPQSLNIPRTMTQSDLAPITALNQPVPLTTQSLQYINGFLRTQIGKKVTVDFLIGTNTLLDRTGTLLAVGANYIIINEVETDDIVICDFYSIKFVRVYY